MIIYTLQNDRSRCQGPLVNAIYEDMVAFDWTVVGEAVAYDSGLRIWSTLKQLAWIPSSSPKEPGALERHLINSLSPTEIGVSPISLKSSIYRSSHRLLHMPVSPNKIPQAPPNPHMCINTAFQCPGNIPKIQLKLVGFLYPPSGNRKVMPKLRFYKTQASACSVCCSESSHDRAQCIRCRCLPGVVYAWHTARYHRHVPVYMCDRKTASSSPLQVWCG